MSIRHIMLPLDSARLALLPIFSLYVKLNKAGWV